MEKKKNNGVLIGLLLGIIVMLLIFVGLFVTNTISFKSTSLENNQTSKISNNKTENSTKNTTEKIADNDSNNENSTKIFFDNKSNMTEEEAYNFWKKIKGNWGHVNYDNDYCSGTSLEINTFVKISKFNSDGITLWNILSFEKINDNNYKINLVSPANLNNEMNGGSAASYTTVFVDISNLNNKKINVSFYGSTVEFEYVGENKTKFDENFQFIDIGFNQDYYCNWYKEKK